MNNLVEGRKWQSREIRWSTELSDMYSVVAVQVSDVWVFDGQVLGSGRSLCGWCC